MRKTLSDEQLEDEVAFIRTTLLGLIKNDPEIRAAIRMAAIPPPTPRKLPNRGGMIPMDVPLPRSYIPLDNNRLV